MVTRVLSREDGQLNKSASSSLVASRVADWSDIDLSFTVNANGELYKKVDASAVKQAVQNLVLTNFFEKPFQPFYGSNVTARLFELVGFVNDDVLISQEVTRAIEAFEPRAEVIRVITEVRPDHNALDLDIEFQVINSNETVRFTTTLSRLR